MAGSSVSTRAQSPPTQVHSPGGGNAVRARLDKAVLLASQVAQSKIATSASAPSPGSTQATGKANLHAQIKSLEAALAHLPDEAAFVDQRNALLTRVDVLKQEISDTKPIGRRIDSTRAALTRAQKRRSEAASLVELAVSLLEDADAEVDKNAGELEQLEGALAKPVVAPTRSSDSVDALHQNLVALLANAKADPHIDPQLVAMAEKHSSELLQGFRATFVASMEAKANNEPTQRVRTRARVKTTPAYSVHAAKVSRRRVIGKQSAAKRSRVLGDFFPAPLDETSSSQAAEGGPQPEASAMDV